MSEENKELLRRWFEEVWHKGRADAIEEMFDENGIADGLSDDPSKPIKGPSGYRPFYNDRKPRCANVPPSLSKHDDRYRGHVPIT